MPKNNKKNSQKKVTRYTHEQIKEPRTPETGHTQLLPADEQVVTLPMDNGWSKAITVGKLSEKDDRPVVLDMDPAADPVLFWAGKRNKREIPVLPLQRNEIVSESRIAQIIERAQKVAAEKSGEARQSHLFADLEKTLREGDKSRRVEFYTHDEGWKNKLICGDSLQVMESLLHYEGLRGKVQMIYMDPPYGIKYDSNFQQRVDSTKNDEEDQADDVLTIKAFRDTWTLGIHSYLSYLQERLYLCRELLTDSGSIFVQINDRNVHLVRQVVAEVFGEMNFVSLIAFAKTGVADSDSIPTTHDFLIWYAKNLSGMVYHKLWRPRVERTEGGTYTWIELPNGSSRRLTSEELSGSEPMPPGKRFRAADISGQGESASGSEPVIFQGKSYRPSPGRHWKRETVESLIKLNRVIAQGSTLGYKRFEDDFPLMPYTHIWDDTILGTFSYKWYVVQTNTKVVERCIAMTTNPGDLVFDPTCGSGTTAHCAETTGRRWITCDTSRVSMNVARTRLLSAVFDHYRTRNGHVSGNFTYKTVNRTTLKSLAYGLESEKVELVDQPEVDKSAVRVCGPLEVMTLGRYSVEDWKGYVISEAARSYGETPKLENYISVISRLYRKDAAIQGASGLIHAIAESEKEKIAISVGPLSGRVTAKQINDAVQDALASGILEVHVLGWAFEANVGEIKSQLESRGRVKIHLVMIRPDTLAEGLKATQPEMLFSPLALPDVEVKLINGKGKPKAAVVTLKGVGVFDRKQRTTEYYAPDSGYVAAWYLDEDYDGDCFVDCQMFFDFKKALNLKVALKVEVEPEEYKLQLTSQLFPVRGYKRIAVKVVDVYGNESTLVKDLN
jgi:adenine-specific DNA-methyltransferase